MCAHYNEHSLDHYLQHMTVSLRSSILSFIIELCTVATTEEAFASPKVVSLKGCGLGWIEVRS